MSAEARPLPRATPELPASPVRSVCSMTGYARVSARLPGAPALTLTLKSMNHRFLDLQLRLPPGSEQLENLVRAELKRELARGHVECTLTLDRLARRDPVARRMPPQFDAAALRAYVASFRMAAAEHGLAAEPDLNLAAALPGILLRGETDTREEGGDQPDPALESDLARELPALLAEAIAALKIMRAREGTALVRTLEESLARLDVYVEEVAFLREGVQEAHMARLSAKLHALLEGAVDEDRILAEAALLAERGDVEEELARMRTHVEHFRVLLRAGGELGKKLDFLLQEMNREANTLLSKTAGITGGGARITEGGLAMKAEIEKLREQVQNLE